MFVPFRFVYPFVLYYTIPLFFIACILRIWWYKEPIYRYTLVTTLGSSGHSNAVWIKRLFNFLRTIILIMLALLCAKPQWGDAQRQITIDGIDIILALDASGSMDTSDFEDDPRSRIDIAKTEAIRFIEKRTNDAIGLVIFGNDALSRCPLTMDKSMLKHIINDLYIGIIDYRGTVLARALIAGANRLKHAKSKSKIMILLTDGEPTDNDIPLPAVLEIIKTLGIKIYTIGIGNDDPMLARRTLFMMPYIGVNKALLTHIATQTGGQYFCARNAADMRRIYDEIDLLEKTNHEAPVFTQWYDIYLPWVLFCLLLISLSILLSTLVWCVL
ncbi:MAG TPA: VWA domain-containing protein [Candidatus Babeliales bacterium]|nr:VWA domain-containing protein [Candidatus Babeliales bacterium]